MALLFIFVTPEVFFSVLYACIFQIARVVQTAICGTDMDINAADKLQLETFHMK